MVYITGLGAGDIRWDPDEKEYRFELRENPNFGFHIPMKDNRIDAGALFDRYRVLRKLAGLGMVVTLDDLTMEGLLELEQEVGGR